jgi:hypothetical protein
MAAAPSTATKQPLLDRAGVRVGAGFVVAGGGRCPRRVLRLAARPFPSQQRRRRGRGPGGGVPGAALRGAPGRRGRRRAREAGSGRHGPLNGPCYLGRPGTVGPTPCRAREGLWARRAARHDTIKWSGLTVPGSNGPGRVGLGLGLAAPPVWTSIVMIMMSLIHMLCLLLALLLCMVEVNLGEIMLCIMCRGKNVMDLLQFTMLAILLLQFVVRMKK